MESENEAGKVASGRWETPLGTMRIDSTYKKPEETISFEDADGSTCWLVNEGVKARIHTDRDWDMVALDGKTARALIAVLETWVKCGSFVEDK